MCFDALLFQSLDELGLPRFTLPVEYVAAAIVAFVHPINYFHGVYVERVSRFDY